MNEPILVPGRSVLGGAVWYLSYYPVETGQEYADNCEARRILAECWRVSECKVSTIEFWNL